MTSPVLEVAALEVDFVTAAGPRRAIDGISFSLAPGQTLGLVGESGSGKTTTALALLGLLPAKARVQARRLQLAGHDLTTLRGRDWRRLRGREAAMIFQDPQSALNPVRTVGRQIVDVLARHVGLRGRAAQRRALELLAAAGLPDPDSAFAAWPHQLSGGMCQRAMIAMAIAARPKLLIADEPTSALDLTTQARVLNTLKASADQHEMALLLISHDLGVIAGLADDVVVMQAGRAVEHAPVRTLFRKPRHRYTVELLDAVPRLDRGAPRPAGGSRAALLAARAVECSFRTRGRRNVVVDAVDLDLEAGQCLAVVGESGAGKSTLARALLRLIEPDAGQVRLDGIELTALAPAALARARQHMQIVFQDPGSALSPRRTVGQSLREPLDAFAVGHRRDRDRRVADWLQRVGLPADAARRYPHEFSGGQRQRICIARALICEPRLLVADEPTSALDVSVQARIIELLDRLRRELDMALLLISHDLALVRQVADQVAVMQRGRIVERTTAAELFARPAHPCTRALLAASPLPDPDRREWLDPERSGRDR